MDDTERIVIPGGPDTPPHRRWWQEPRWIGVIALLLFAIGNSVWAVSSLMTRAELTKQSSVVDRTGQVVTGPLSDTGNKVSSDVTVALAEIAQIRALICASNDPIRLEACGKTPIPTAPPDTEPPPSTTSAPTPATSSHTTTTAPVPAPTCTTLPNGRCHPKQ